MGIMSIVKSVIEHFRKAGKTEKEISNMIEQRRTAGLYDRCCD